jgi:tetratricopeptide (TPR) repeat protein
MKRSAPLAFLLLLISLLSAHAQQAEEIVFAQILPGSAAEKAGLLPHDVILSFDGTNITSVKQFIEARGNRAGTLRIRRAHQTLSINIPEGKLGAVISRSGARWQEFQKRSPQNTPAAEHVKKATQLMDSLEFLDAANLFESAIRAGITDPQLYLWTATCYVKLIERQPPPSSEKFLRNALHYSQLAKENIPEDPSHAPELSDLFFLLGRLDMLQNHYDAARQNLLTSLHWNSANASALWQLGWTMKQLGKNQESIHYLEQAAQSLPQNEDLLSNLARAYADAGQLDRANATYLKVLEANPKALAARLDRANVLIALKRFSEAEDEINRVLAATEPSLNRETQETAYDSLGRIAYAQNDFPRAALLFRKAVELYPLANTYYLLAAAETQIGDYRLAAEHISLFMRHNPDTQKNLEYTSSILKRLLPHLTRKEWDDFHLSPYANQLHLKPKSSWRDILSSRNPFLSILALLIVGAILIALHRFLLRRKHSPHDDIPSI